MCKFDWSESNDYLGYLKGNDTQQNSLHFYVWASKTRSGKIMRRILRKIAANEHSQLGDTTTLADPSVVTSLVDNRKNT